MAKAKLIFDLENPEDRKAHMRCVKSLDMAIALFYISHNLKKECEQKNSEEILDHVFEKISELFEDNNINLEELID